MKAKINNSLIKKLSPADKEYEVHDTDIKGFIVRVFPSGTMRYVCQVVIQKGCYVKLPFYSWIEKQWHESTWFAPAVKRNQ